MKKIVTLLLCVFAIALVGCSATPLTQEQLQLQEASYIAQSDCYERLEARDAQIAQQIAQVPPEQIGLVIVLQQMQESNQAMMSLATGNQYNPCDIGSTAFDVQIAEVRSKNLALSSGMTGAFGLGKWIVGGVTATAIADKIGGDVITATGGSEVNQNAKNTTVDSGGAATTTTTHTSQPTSSDDHSVNKEDEETGEVASGECGEGMTLRISTGECITLEEEAAIEAAAAAE